MSSIYNFLESPIKRNGGSLLQSCFYIFSLKAGCRLIALLEALISGMQIYFSRQDIWELTHTTTKLQSELVTQEAKGSHTTATLFVDNSYFANALHTLVLLNSVILIAGIELANISFLILWIGITILSKAVDMIIHIIQGNDLTGVFFFCTSLILKIYFCAVVASLILKFADKLRASALETETEVLYTQSEEV